MRKINTITIAALVVSAGIGFGIYGVKQIDKSFSERKKEEERIVLIDKEFIGIGNLLSTTAESYFKNQNKHPQDYDLVGIQGPSHPINSYVKFDDSHNIIAIAVPKYTQVVTDFNFGYDGFSATPYYSGTALIPKIRDQVKIEQLQSRLPDGYIDMPMRLDLCRRGKLNNPDGTVKTTEQLRKEKIIN